MPRAISERIDLRLPEFEDWLRTARAEAEELTTAVYEALLARLAQLPDAAPRTEDIAQRLIAVDPLNESGHRALIEAAATSGHTDRAVRLYEAYQHRLADELGILPGREIRQSGRGLRGIRTQPRAVEPATPGTERPGRPVVFVARRPTNGNNCLINSPGLNYLAARESGRLSGDRRRSIRCRYSTAACDQTPMRSIAIWPKSITASIAFR